MLNVEKICEHLDCTEDELAKLMGVSKEILYKYKNGTQKVRIEMLVKLSNETGILIDDLSSQQASANRSELSANPENTWKAAQEAKNSLKEYVKAGLDAFEGTNEETVKKELKKLDDCMKAVRKPKITFAGQSDTGKSTLINMLLNSDKMPVDWTATTSIAVHIKHIDDRPEFVKENVCIFRQFDNFAQKDLCFDDEECFKKYMIASGDYSVLNVYGTHQDETDDTKIASSAVVFMDAPLLKNCDVLDLPGFAVNDEDDELHRFYTQQNQTDILIYLSRSNGFLQNGDLQCISDSLRHLRPIESKGENGIEPLGNLFVIASQAHTIDNGNATALKRILDQRCSALALVLTDSDNGEILSYRSKITGYKYDAQALRKRFFTFEKSQPRLCREFMNAFTEIAEKLPKAIQESFCDNIGKLIAESKIILKNKVDEYESVVGNSEKYVNLLRSVRDNEPMRKLEQEEKKKAILSLIENLKKSSAQDAVSEYNDITDIDRMTAMMDGFGYKNKKESREEFAAYFSNQLKSRIEKVVESSNEKYKSSLDEYLSDYSLSFEKYKFSSDVNLSFDTQGVFREGLKGLVSIGVAGASAVWLSTSTTAFIAAAFGASLGLAPLLATLGVLGIGLGSVGIALKSLWDRFAGTWKKDFAKAIVKEYNKKDFVEKMKAGTDEYWNNTKDSFLAACDNVEKEWEKKIDECEKLADEKALPELKSKLEKAKNGLEFYEHVPTEYND